MAVLPSELIALRIARDVVAPIVFAYAVFCIIVLSSWRDRRRTPGPPPTSARYRDFLRYVVITFVGGFVAFLAIVLVFHVWLAGQRRVLVSAARGGGMLALLAAPSFAGLSWLERRWTRRG